MNKTLALITTTALVFTAATGAIAQPGNGKGKDKRPDHTYEHSDKRDGDELSIRIDLDDRNIIEDFLRTEYRSDCPPGLAKKNNGCLPPGIAKKYELDQPLPPGITARSIDDSLYSRLRHINGYEYVRVDKDILLVSEATKKVVDAVTLLSAVE